MTGTLFVVATPIGNLEDLTFRALRVLGEVSLIAAEDTRRTAKLLAHYKLHTPMISVREHNEAAASVRVVARLLEGASVALVSDAGTPGIADPGARLVAEVRRHGIRVVPIPGASAVAAALSVSGMPSDQFVFMGFPPASGSARTRWFETLAMEPRLVVFFESPHRIRQTMQQLASVNRPIMALRELTKVHESLVESPNNDLADIVATGEFTLIAAPLLPHDEDKPDVSLVFRLFRRLTTGDSFEHDEAIAIAAKVFGVSAAYVSKCVKKGKILVNQRNASLP
jgi:16S rRNA (cytidine1402-2'-O)-methyltransferase